MEFGSQMRLPYRHLEEMLIRSRYLVVAAIISGRNFPEKDDSELVCEARFDNELLSTDPVSHAVQPQFEQELAWELDRSSLRQHRLQRSVLKIWVYTKKSQSGTKESLGYFVLDIRTCSSKRSYRWYRLLHSKYKPTPEVFCGIYLDGDACTDNIPDELSKLDLIPRIVYPSDGSGHQTMTDDSSVQYIIGPDSKATTEFLFTLNWKEVAYLTSLISIHEKSEEDASGFSLSCELFGSFVVLRPLGDLEDGIYERETHCFRIRSNVRILRSYFLHISPLVITLHRGEQPVAIASVPVDNLLPSGSDDPQLPIVLEDKFLFSPVSHSTTTVTTPLSDQAYVRVRLTLESLSTSPKLTEKSEKPINFGGVDDPPKRNSPGKFLRSEGNVTRSNPESPRCSPSALRRSPRSPVPPDDASIRHFCYTVELRSLRLVNSLSPEPMIYARYLYPLFGSGAPVMTLPPVPVVRNRETLLHNGFCAFEFAASTSELHDRLLASPLLVEIYDRSTGSKSGDRLVAYAKIQLAAVFGHPALRGSTDRSLTRKVSDVVDLLAPASTNTALGQMNYNLTLEDLGPYNGDSHQLGNVKTLEVVEQQPEVADIRNTAEYRTAFELELWRAQEEAKFQTQMKQREQQLMATFAEEWRKRDREREATYRKKLTEYQLLEDKLRSALGEVTMRENQLAAGEAELARIRQNTMREVDRKRKDLAQISQTRVHDLEGQLKLANRKLDDLQKQLKESQSRCGTLENENAKLHTRLEQTEREHTKPENAAPPTSYQLELAQLTTELANARVQLADSERRLNEVQQGRTRYRQLWTRALREVARLKEEAVVTAQQALAKREAELEKLRMRYLYVEETQLDSRLSRGDYMADRKEVREDRQAPKEMEAAGIRPTGEMLVSSRNSPSPEQELTRLINERDDLLNSGVYDADDEIIVQLERRIESLFVSK